MSKTASTSNSEGKLPHLLAARLPGVWYSPLPGSLPAPLQAVLSVASRFYGAGLNQAQRRTRLHARRLPAVVISVGNLVAGGTGKTPFTLWLARYLLDRGQRPAILSRGYGGRCRSGRLVPAQGETCSQVLEHGDEPVLMARKGFPVPVRTGRDRWISGSSAIHDDSADHLILDDGFQHLALHRDLDLVLLDAQNPFGNGALLPLGPLREPARHLERADAFILTRADDPAKTEQVRAGLRRQFPDKPSFACRHVLAGVTRGLTPPLLPLPGLHRRTVLAFAGIARPEPFFQSLRDARLDLVASRSFPDHYQYRNADLLHLFETADSCGAQFLVTTEKDAVRLSPEMQASVLATELRLDFGTDEKRLRDYLDRRLGLS